jgi:hypothetical protein
MRKASLPTTESNVVFMKWFIDTFQELSVPKGAVAAADTQCIPGQIKNMVEYIKQKGLNKEYIFYRSAAASSLQTIKERIERGLC